MYCILLGLLDCCKTFKQQFEQYVSEFHCIHLIAAHDALIPRVPLLQGEFQPMLLREVLQTSMPSPQVLRHMLTGWYVPWELAPCG